MTVKIDLTDKTFGRLLVTIQAPSVKGRIHWWTLCSCGVTKSISSCHLLSGATKSCGCMAIERLVKDSATHRRSKSKVYRVWAGIIQRCVNEKASRYAEYGGRGITVCERWRESFEDFLIDMGELPSTSHSIDRIDCNGNYTPSNCRWATTKEQANNKNNTVYLSLGSKTLPMGVWAELIGIPHATFNCRKQRGWSDAKILTTPRKGYNDVIPHSISELYIFKDLQPL